MKGFFLPFIVLYGVFGILYSLIHIKVCNRLSETHFGYFFVFKQKLDSISPESLSSWPLDRNLLSVKQKKSCDNISGGSKSCQSSAGFRTKHLWETGVEDGRKCHPAFSGENPPPESGAVGSGVAALWRIFHRWSGPATEKQTWLESRKSSLLVCVSE